MADSRDLAGGGTVPPSYHENNSNKSNSTADLDVHHLAPPSFVGIVTFIVVSSIVASLIEGFVPRKFLRVLPQPVLLMILYIFLGAAVGQPFAVEIEAEMILTIVLPPLLTNEALKIRTTPFYKSIIGLIWLIGPALFLGAAIVAVYPFAFFPAEDRFNWNLSMAFGGMLATTDPIAMIFLAEVMTPRRLSAMVSGESLLNDATSIICVFLFLGLNAGKAANAGDIIFYIVNQLVFSVLWGCAVGMVTFAVLRKMKVLDSHTLFAMSISAPFLAFTIATYYFKDSGVLSLIPVGLFFNHFMSAVATEDRVHAIQEFWETLSFLVCSWLYALTGLLVGIELADQAVLARDWGSLFGLYFWVLLARFIVVLSCMPVFMNTGYGFSIREGILLAWGGLRGAVGLLLALIIRSDKSISKREGKLVLFMMAGIVVIVQLQGVTFPVLLKWLKVVISPNARVHDTMRTKMSYRAVFVLSRAGVPTSKAREVLFIHKESKEKMNEPTATRFSTKRKQTAMVNDPDMMQHTLSGSWVSKSVLNDKRKRLLQAQRAIYNNLISRGLISRSAWLVLVRSVDFQLDSDEVSLNQWEFLLKSTPRVLCTCFGRTKDQDTARLLCALFGQDLSKYFVECKLNSNKNKDPETNSSPKAADDLENTKIAKSKSSANFSAFHSCCGQGEDAVDGAEVGAEIHSRDFGIDCEEPVTFGFVSWAFLIAQNHSLDLVEEMFKLDDDFIAFDSEQLALKDEIKRSRREPALYLDLLMGHFPELAKRIKAAQAVAEVKDQVYGYVEELFNDGLIDTHAMKKLLRDADKIVRVAKQIEYPLEMPCSVGPNGDDVLQCPNFHPFFQSDLLKKFSMEELRMDDLGMMFQDALIEKSEPIREGFWAKRQASQPTSTDSEAGAAPISPTVSPLGNPPFQISFADASIQDEHSNIDSVTKQAESADQPNRSPVLGASSPRSPEDVALPKLQFGVNDDFVTPPPDQEWSGAVKLDNTGIWNTVLTPNKPTLSREQSARILQNPAKVQLIRQLSGGQLDVSDAKEGPAEVAPMKPAEYHSFLVSRPPYMRRVSSLQKN